MSEREAPSAATVVSRRLTVWITGLSLVFVVLLVGLFLTFHLRDVERQNAAISYSFGRHVTAYVEQAVDALSVLAALQEALPPDNLRAAMEGMGRTLPQLERLVLLNDHGEVTDSAPGGLTGIGLPSHHYRDPGRAYIAPRPETSLASGRLMLYVEVPGPHGGSVGGELRLTELQTFLNGLFPMDSRRLTALCDRYGNLLAHSNPQMVLQQANIGNLAIMVRAREGRFGTALFMDRGTAYLGTVARVPGTPWLTLLAQPVAEVSRPVLQTLGLLAVLAILFIPLLVWVLRATVHHTLDRPLAALSGSIRAIAAGGEEARPQGMDAVAEFATIADEVGLMARTIADRETALRRAEEHYRSIFENIPDGYYRADMDGNVVMANPEGAKMMGFDSPEEAIGLNIARDVYVTPAARGEFMRRLLEQGKLRGYQMTIKRRDGSVFEAEANTLLIRDPATGEPLGVEGMFRDVTERKRMQQVMIQTEKMMSVGGLAAGMAHEINNPLAGILQGLQNLERRLIGDVPGNRRAAEALGLDVELLARYAHERDVPQTIQGIRESAVRAAAIVSTMLNFSRRSEGRKEPCDLAEVVDTALSLAASDHDLRTGYDFRKVELVRELDPDLPPVPCTRTEIEQVLFNLVKNAAHALAGAGSPARPRITVRTRLDGARAVLEVEDNGPGIPPESRARIFEPFYTTKPPGVGTGLGLSVSFFIITQNHGGLLGVRSTPGQSTTFTIRLPLVPPEPDAHPHAGPDADPDSGAEPGRPEDAS